MNGYLEEYMLMILLRQMSPIMYLMIKQKSKKLRMLINVMTIFFVELSLDKNVNVV